MLQGTEFQSKKELLEVTVHILSDIPLETLITTFQQRMGRIQAGIDDHGEYVE
jgi:hypothetical protein